MMTLAATMVDTCGHKTTHSRTTVLSAYVQMGGEALTAAVSQLTGFVQEQTFTPSQLLLN